MAVRPVVTPTSRTTAPAVLRRSYADVASDKIQLNLALPHQACPLYWVALSVMIKDDAR